MIDYIDDTIQDPPPNATPTVVSGTYNGSFKSMAPDGLIMVNGQSQAVTLNFKNNGGTTWQQGTVYLKVTNKGEDTSSFGAPAKIEMNEVSVSASQVASFTVNLIAPTDKIGLQNQEFTLMYNKASVPTKIASIGKFIIIKSGVAAQIINHNLPVAVRNDWKPIDIEMNIKNTSADITWLSRRTALELKHHDGTTSPFYDPNDWVRKEVVGVPLNGATIGPGETGEFKFTLDPRGIKPGIYILTFELKLLDKEKDVYLSGGLKWKREIRVD